MLKTKNVRFVTLFAFTLMLLSFYATKASPPPPPYTVYVLQAVGPCAAEEPCLIYRYFATAADRENFLAVSLPGCWARRANTTYSSLPGPDGEELYFNCE